MRKFNNNQRGFTLIEMMISSAIFVVIVLVGTTILITATNNYRTNSEIRQSMDTLSFVMEDMTRNIRLGTDFHCGPNQDMSIASIQAPLSCLGSVPGQAGAWDIEFEPFDLSGEINPNPAQQVIYSIDTLTNNALEGSLFKKTETNSNALGFVPGPSSAFSQITPADIHLNMHESGFTVTENNNGTIVPAVTIRLAGTVISGLTTVPFDIQSTVAPRNIPAQGQ